MLTGSCPKPLLSLPLSQSCMWLSDQAKLGFASKESDCTIVPFSKLREQTEAE